MIENQRPMTGDEIAGAIGVFSGGCLFVVAVGIFGYQCLEWLRNGIWHPLALGLAWDYFIGTRPTTSWLGLQKIIDGALGLPLAFGTMVFAFVAMLSPILVWSVVSASDSSDSVAPKQPSSGL